MGLKFGFDEHPDIKFKRYHIFEVTQALASTDLIENKGMSKEGQLVIGEIYEHVEDQLKDFPFTFAIRFKPF